MSATLATIVLTGLKCYQLEHAELWMKSRGFHFFSREHLGPFGEK